MRRLLANWFRLKHFREGSNRVYQPFVLLAHPRTGSNWLCSLLASQPEVVCFLELFNLNDIWIGNIKPMPSRRFELFLRNQFTELFLQKCVFRGFDPAVKAVGFKLQLLQSSMNPRIRKFLAKQPSMRILWLERANRLSSYVSLQKARATQQYVLRGPKTVRKEVKIQINIEDLLKFLEEQERLDEDHQAFFKNHEQLVVNYEDLESDPQETVQRIYEWLGLGQERRQFESNLRRQEVNPLPLAIKNYDEVSARLRGTRWEHYLPA